MSIATTIQALMTFGFPPQLAGLFGDGKASGVSMPLDITLGSITGGETGGLGTDVTITGGTSTGTSAGSSVILTPGTVSTGAAGGIFQRGLRVPKQGTPAAKTVTVTLTAAEVLTGIITGNQAGAAAASYTLPLATDLQTALPVDVANDDAFDFAVINLSTVAAEDITILTNTGWTLVGSMVIESRDSDRAASSAMFRARRTATNTYTLYRIA